MESHVRYWPSDSKGCRDWRPLYSLSVQRRLEARSRMESRTIVCYLGGICRRLELLEQIYGRFPSVDPSGRFAGVLNLGKPQGEGGREGRCLQGNLWYSPPASMTSRLASVTFKMASKMFIEETARFNYFFWNEMSSSVMNFKDSFLSSSKFYRQSYRPVTLLTASAQQDWGV